MLRTMPGPSTRDYPSYLQPIQGFQPLKAAQLCALFGVLSGGHVEKLKLIKLVYLTERRFLSMYSEPILWDEFFSLPHGPVCSSTLNCIDGVLFAELISQYFTTAGRRNVHPVKRFSLNEFDALSEAEIEVASEIWKEFGHMTSSQIRNYTHKNCPEYFELESGRRPISYEDVLAALGLPDHEEVANEIFSYREMLAKNY